MKNIKLPLTLENLINAFICFYIISLYIFTYREKLNNISNTLAFLMVALIWINFVLCNKNLVVNKFIYVQFIFIIICFISILYSVNQYTALSKVNTLLLIFVVLISLVNYVDTYEKIRKIVNYLIFSGVIASIYILLSSDFSRIARFGGQLGNVNAIGLLIAISGIFCFSMIITEKKAWLIPFLLVMIPMVLATGSRKSLLLLIISLSLITYFRSKHSILKKIKFIIICLCIIIVFYYIIFKIPFFYRIIGIRFENLFDFIKGEGTKEGSINIRSNMINAGLELFINKPLFGYGIDNYRHLYSGTYSHNNYIELLVGTGLVGASVYYLTHIIVIKDLYNFSKKTIYKIPCYTFLAIIISYMILAASLVCYDAKLFSIILTIASKFPYITSYEVRN